MSRSTMHVFEDHLRLRVGGDLEADLRRNYSEMVILLTENSNAQGHNALRTSARRLAEQLPNGRFEFLSKQVNGPYALLIWRAESDRFDVIGGADSFLIEHGKIQMQTIHYQLISKRPAAPAWPPRFNPLAASLSQLMLRREFVAVITDNSRSRLERM